METENNNSVVKITNIESQDWFKAMIDECSSIITERGFNARDEVIHCYHEIGTRILEENENFERSKVYGKDIVHRVAKSLSKSKRVVYYALEFVRKYPDLGKLPEGKNLSWSRICKVYLPKHSSECPHSICGDKIITVCKNCGKHITSQNKGGDFGVIKKSN
jgi:hypothetical protein